MKSCRLIVECCKKLQISQESALKKSVETVLQHTISVKQMGKSRVEQIVNEVLLVHFFCQIGTLQVKNELCKICQIKHDQCFYPS